MISSCFFLPIITDWVWKWWREMQWLHFYLIGSKIEVFITACTSVINALPVVNCIPIECDETSVWLGMLDMHSVFFGLKGSIDDLHICCSVIDLHVGLSDFLHLNCQRDGNSCTFFGSEHPDRIGISMVVMHHMPRWRSVHIILQVVLCSMQSTKN